MLNKAIALGALLSVLSTQASADVGFMAGVGWTFGGGGPALTIKVLSSDSRNEGVVAAGASYYPLVAKKFGLDLGAGYQFDNAAAIVSWDFLQNGVQLSGGWADTESNKRNSPAPVAPPPAGPAA